MSWLYSYVKRNEVNFNCKSLNADNLGCITFNLEG